MDIIKHNLNLTLDKNDELKKKFGGLMTQTFKPERLIARDDKGRFHSSYSDDDQANSMGGSAGGDSTFGMSIFKSLKALACYNDRIFVILDDREDLWVQSDNTIPRNLLKIPAYFFHSVQNMTSKL